MNRGYLRIGLELRAELALPLERFQYGDRKLAGDDDLFLELDRFLPGDFDLDVFLHGDIEPFLPEDFDLDLFLCGDQDLCAVEVLLGKGDAEFDGTGPPWLVAWRLGLELWAEEAGSVVVVGGCSDSSGAELKEEDEQTYGNDTFL